MHVCQIGFRFIAHVAPDLVPFWLFAGIVESSTSVGVVSTNAIDQRFYRIKRAFVENEVTRDYVYWAEGGMSFKIHAVRRICLFAHVA